MSQSFLFPLHRQNMGKYNLLASINPGTRVQLRLVKLYHDRGFATTHDDRVLAFGDNSQGLLGLGHAKPVVSTNELTSLRGKSVVDIVCGPDTNLARTNEGKVYQFGGHDGTPKLIIDDVAVVELNCACQFWSLALANTGTVLTWSRSSPPTALKSFSGIVQIDSGLYHSIARDVGGKLWVWGSNAYLQLGLVDRKIMLQQPMAVKTYEPIKQIVCGALHTTFLTISGRLFISGRGRTVEMSSAPVEFDKPISLKQMFVISYQLACVEAKDVLLVGLTNDNQALVWAEADKPSVVCYQQVDREHLLNLIRQHSKYCLVPGMIEIHSNGPARSEQLVPLCTSPVPAIRGNIGLTKKLVNLFDKADGCDVVFKFPTGQTIRAHRVMLMIGSMYLRRKLETTWKNANPIIMVFYSYNVYYRYLKYLYTGQLMPATLLDDKMSMCQLVLEYETEELIEPCQLEVIDALTTDNCLRAFQMAEERKLGMMVEQISRFIDANLEELADEYKSGGRLL